MSGTNYWLLQTECFQDLTKKSNIILGKPAYFAWPWDGQFDWSYVIADPTDIDHEMDLEKVGAGKLVGKQHCKKQYF